MTAEVLTYPAHARAVLKLGLPLIGGHLGQVAIGVTDTVMLGRYGLEELAAVTLAGNYFFVLFLMGSGFAWAVMPMVATSVAEEDETSVRRATRMGLWLSLLFCVFAVPAMLMAKPVLLTLGQDPALSALAQDYLGVAAWGIVPALMVMTFKSFLAALERTQVVFWITLVAALANALGNYMLIFGNWGAPELGVIGAAIASVLTQGVMLAGVVIYTQVSVPEYSLFQRFWRPDWEMFGQVFRLGWPIGLTTLSEVGLFSASALMMGLLGTVALAAHGIVLQLASITFMVHLGLANVATIRAGNARGRRDLDRLMRGAHVVLALSVAMAVATIIVFVAVPEPLIEVFMKPDEPAREATLALGVVLLALAALFQLVDGAQAVALGLLRGLQDTRVPMILAAVSYWGVGIPASYGLGIVLGFEGPGVWMGLVLGLAVAAVLLNWRFWRVTVRNLGFS